MRKLARFILLGAVVVAGCGPTVEPLVLTPGEPAALQVAFGDIPVEKVAAPPLSLTSSTGAGLALVELRGRAVLDDPLAFTELHLVFENPEDRVIEGNFNIVLPQGAVISRFAMRNEQGFQEGEVVEKQKARAAYEDFLHRRQDPALLEQNAGNEFSARVFPIPARGRKELVVSYQQELLAPYALSLKGLPKIGVVDLEAHVAGRAAPVARLVQQNVTPDADFRVEKRAIAGHAALRNGEIVVTRVAPVVGSQPEPLGSAVILVDTSASRALGMADEARVVAELCATMARAGSGRVVVAAFDQLVQPLHDGPAAGFGAEALGRMRQRLALGASDLGAALAWAGPEARRIGAKRVVIVSDGVPTAGKTGGDELRALSRGLTAHGVERVDAVAVGGIRDDDLLRSVANAGLPRGGVVVDAAAPPEEIGRRLSEATRSGLSVQVEGADFVWPPRIDGVQAGDEVLVFARVPEGRAVRVSVGGGAWTAPETTPAERPLLERAWIGARIKSLLEAERVQGPSEQLSQEIVRLSTRHRVLSPKTALLVLETDNDYARFGIDRRALADILVAEGGKIRVMTRAAPQPVDKPPPPPVVVEKRRPEPPKKKASAGPPKALRPSAGKESFAKRAADKADEEEIAMPAPRPSPVRSALGGAPPPEPIDGTRDFNRAREADRRPPPPPAGAAPAPEPPPPPPPPPAMEPAPRMADRAPARPPPASPPPPAPAREMESPRMAAPAASSSPQDDEPRGVDPYAGPFKDVMDLLRAGKIAPALTAAFDWRKTAPGDVMALVALGEGFEAAGDHAQAARCYGSIIDLFPGRADLRRFAGERLERLPPQVGLDLASDAFGKAEEQRPDHPASHRLHAYALLRRGQYEKAFEAIVRGVRQRYPGGRFAGVERILAEDVGLIGAAWARAEPNRAAEILRRVRAEGGTIEDEPSIRFVLTWETDANDVDFHIHDGVGGHAFYRNKVLPSGGELYADVTTGYGPECFTIRAPAERRHGPYKLEAHYYSRGPMGYGMGKLEIVEHDGKGGLRFEERPFVVMADRAFVDLGTVER